MRAKPWYNAQHSVSGMPPERAVQHILDYTGGGWEPGEHGELVFLTRSGEPFVRVEPGYALLKLASLCRNLARNEGTVWRS